MFRHEKTFQLLEDLHNVSALEETVRALEDLVSVAQVMGWSEWPVDFSESSGWPLGSISAEHVDTARPLGLVGFQS